KLEVQSVSLQRQVGIPQHFGYPIKFALNSELRSKLSIQRARRDTFVSEQIPKIREVLTDVFQTWKSNRLTVAPRHILTHGAKYDPRVTVRSDGKPNTLLRAIIAYLKNRFLNCRL